MLDDGSIYDGSLSGEKVGIKLNDFLDPSNSDLNLSSGLQIEAVIWNGNTPIVVDSETV
jgi:hypothetical protein